MYIQLKTNQNQVVVHTALVPMRVWVQLPVVSTFFCNLILIRGVHAD